MTTEEALDFLYDPARNRYRGVYPAKGRKWRAMSQAEGKWSQVAPVRTTQEEAALDLAKHLEGIYGDRWTDVYTAGTKESFSRLLPYRVYKTGRLFVVEVWVSGSPVEVTPELVENKSGAWAGGWSSRKDAFRAMKEFRRRFKNVYDPEGRPAVVRV